MNNIRLTKILQRKYVASKIIQDYTFSLKKYFILSTRALSLTFYRYELVSECRRAESGPRCGPKTVPAKTAEITKCHAIFIVFFGDDDNFVVKKKFRTF